MFTTRPELRGTFGMVATTHWVATATAMSILERGGNAFDAAVAAGLVLQVVEPHQNGPGGDLPVVFYSAVQKHAKVLCAQAPAPAGATIEHYRAQGLDLVPGTGLLAAVIPGAFDGWMQLLRDYGTLSLRTIMEPAIGYARNGYPVAPVMSAYIAKVADLFQSAWPSSADVYLKDGEGPAAGSLFSNPALANTYDRILQDAEAAAGLNGSGREGQMEAARAAFYRGFVAEAIDAFCRETDVLDSSGQRNRGVLTGQDMAQWQAVYEDPLGYDYAGYTVYKTAPWGQGPAFLQMLALLKGIDLTGADPVGPDFLHIVTEVIKLALADREAWYGDPDHVDVPMDVLLSDAYNDVQRALITDEASFDLRPGEVQGREIRLPETVARDIPVAAGVGEPNVALAGEVRSDTVNVNVADRWGNLVSCMPSGGWLQSSPVIPELGFCLGTRAQMFWLEEGLPASLAPGKRPRSTLTPGLAFRDGKPYMAFGSPGGDGQDQWALLMFLRHIHCGLNLQAAIDAPAILSHHAPNSFYPRMARPGELEAEDRLPKATIDELRRRGHDVTLVDGWSLGRLGAVARENGLLKAASNPRFMQGYAAGR